MAKKTKGTGKGNLLLVDADAPLRHAMSRTLTLDGYVVFEAGDPHEAFLLSETLSRPLHLLIVDVVLDVRLNGVDLARHLQVLRPSLRVLYLSALPGDAVARGDLEASLPAFLSKPPEEALLLRKTAAALRMPPEAFRHRVSAARMAGFP